MPIPQPRFVGNVMAALGRQIRDDTALAFTAAQVGLWTRDDHGAGLAANALERLQRHGFVQLSDIQPAPTAAPWRLSQQWVLTAAGAEACAVAAGMSKLKQRPVDPGALSTRLWNLLRIRKVLTADDAVSTLCDAGADAARMQRTVAEYLHAWSQAHPKAIQVSARRIGGFKRYVLVHDLGASPPPVSARKPAPRLGARA